MNNPSDPTHHSDSPNLQVYLVPYRWWRDAQDNENNGNGKDVEGVVYSALPSSTASGPFKLINNIFNSDIAFSLRREEKKFRNGEEGAGVSGRDFALVSGEMWLHALKWHTDNEAGMKDGKRFLAGEDDIADVYPLQLRLSVLRETSCLGVRIIKKDNAVELFKRACKIFTVESDMLRMWDFSGQTSLFFSNDRSKASRDCQKQLEPELLLELQVYGLSDSLKSREGKKYDLVNPFTKSSLSVNGNASNSIQSNLTFTGHSGEVGSLGLAGLQNLGNTCFMNSALQCLAHTPKLVDYFLGDYGREINHENPLGMHGEIALAFGDLLRKLWAPGASSVAPRTFKSKLARFAPQFNGFNQHDSQELLAFLLDGLHEDLNRVKCKPYVEAKDEDDRPVEEIADEYWRYHLARNDSIIVDTCQGQYKSTLVCPVCRKVSVTFDPFMYLTLPLPSTTMRTMTLTVVDADGMTRPTPYTVTVSKFGKCQDLIQALSVACALGDDQTLLVAEIYNNRIIRFLEDPADSLSLIRDEDRLVAYRLKKDIEDSPLVIFMHQQTEQCMYGKSTVSWKAFGIPLAAKLSNSVTGQDIHDMYIKLLNPLHVLNGDASDVINAAQSTHVEEVNDVDGEKGSPLVDERNHADSEKASPLVEEENDVDSEKGSALVKEDNNVDSKKGSALVKEECGMVRINSNSALAKEMTHSAVNKGDVSVDAEFEFYLSDEKGLIKDSKIDIDGTLAITGPLKESYIIVRWPKKYCERYDTCALSTLPEVYKSGFCAKKPQESVSFYQCLEGFLTEEPLGPDDMWFCPGCKQFRQASKKLDLWRLPEILVIHLKRFSYSQFRKNKLEAYVEFPIENLDLSSYVAYKNVGSSDRYVLYAISNHYGSMGGGHYTAFVHHGGDRWYDFDDSHVYPISRDKIKTSAAYVLFYRRVVDE